MARLSAVLTHALSLAGSAVTKASTATTDLLLQPQQQHHDCARVEAPTSLTWLLQDQPFEQEDPSSFFYVNQDIDATGRVIPRVLAWSKANRVAQLVTFGAPLEQESTSCRLLFVMPEDSESWELVQREGLQDLRVFRIPTDPTDDAVRQQHNLVSTIKVRPGTQFIDLGSCDGSGSFVFELTGAGRSRLAFRQASKPNDGWGVFMGSECPVVERTNPEDL
ncbi:hypothetical protein CPLU01_11936 [Colletotrichum plurivorum]|uniref:Ubiquitin 3 binding protein But2 C-terminal domain-containing protein n=1 Tax=Colletotrichum plurivorum TaxID=2175906 RepID=A0A8H6K1K2_9PEZI|nr:hypothetical protein CPLU01_11936 [Colletotrichum plurivorum]